GPVARLAFESRAAAVVLAPRFLGSVLAVGRELEIAFDAPVDRRQVIRHGRLLVEGHLDRAVDRLESRVLQGTIETDPQRAVDCRGLDGPSDVIDLDPSV